MNYDALMAFAVFADHQNFTHAAEELFISQPALHAKVGKLAGEVGTPLYVREGRDLVLTEAGRLLAAHAREVASLTEDALARVADTGERGPVILASGAGAFLHLLGPTILKARDGPFPLRLLTMNGPDSARAVLQARAHVAVGVLGSSAADLQVDTLREVRQMVVMPSDHPLAGRKRLRPKDLTGASLIIAPEGMPHRLSTERVLDEHGVPWSVAMEATGWNLMVRFVSYGLGVTVVNDFVPVPDGLVGIPIRGFPVVRYEVATRPDAPHDGTSWLRDLLLEPRTRKEPPDQ